VTYGDNWDLKSDDLDRTETVPVEVTIQFERSDYLNYQVTSATVKTSYAPAHSIHSVA
jgi:hypothetical protein